MRAGTDLATPAKSTDSAYLTIRIGGEDPLRSHSGFRLDRGS